MKTTYESEWKLLDDDMNVYECKNEHCKFNLYLSEGTPEDNKYNYCPRCGIKMITKYISSF